MDHVRVSDKDIYFALMQMTANMFPVTPIKHLVNHYSEPTMTQKQETGTKPSVSNIHALFCPCVVKKDTAHVDTKVLNMHHQSRNGFCVIFAVIPQHQRG